MTDREKVTEELQSLRDFLMNKAFNENNNSTVNVLMHYRDVVIDTLALLKEQEAVQPKTIPEELKQKMWNALWTEEDMLEEKYVGTEEHDGWFFIYRPWLQKGFNLAIEAIANWEGR